MASSNKSTTSRTSARGSKATQPRVTKPSATRNEEETLLAIAKQAYDLQEQVAALEMQQSAIYEERKRLADAYSKGLIDLVQQKAQFKPSDYVVVEVSAQKRVGIVLKYGIKVPSLDERTTYYIVGQGRKNRTRKEFIGRIVGDIGQAVAGCMTTESMRWIVYEVALIRPNGYAEVNSSEYIQAQLAPYTGDFVTVVPKVAKLQV